MKNLRAPRGEWALSIDALAAHAGVSNKTVVEIEAGRVRPKMRTMRRLSEAPRVGPQDVQEVAQVLGLADASAPRTHLVRIQASYESNGTIASLAMSAHEPDTELRCVRLVTITSLPAGIWIESDLGGRHRGVRLDAPGFGHARLLLGSAATMMDLTRDQGAEHDETRRFAQTLVGHIGEYFASAAFDGERTRVEPGRPRGGGIGCGMNA